MPIVFVSHLDVGNDGVRRPTVRILLAKGDVPLIVKSEVVSL